ncbi:hypothetical protein NQ315_016499 [Exocentrus adspersus]|uniref:C-type lectin domain-containing protein n=1 Tax=Exocentrus adspersus TaxID=1586481 RepID=A0AAV8W0K9_9CUCU|nr:hypothetical protein NQ315_016499 [Exocentrus adspersus]
MELCFLVMVLLIHNSFQLPNGVEVKEPPPKSEYSDWYEIFYKSNPIIPFSRTKRKTYFIGKYFRVNFLQANLFCKLMDMHLITIQSKEENDEVNTILQNNNVTGDYWSSATRMFDGNTWIWMSTAKSLQYKNWGPGQPNNKNDHCILLTKANGDLIWNDRNCNCRFFFLCEKSEDETVLYVAQKNEPGIRKYYRSYFD